MLPIGKLYYITQGKSSFICGGFYGLDQSDVLGNGGVLADDDVLDVADNALDDNNSDDHKGSNDARNNNHGGNNIRNKCQQIL